MKALAVWTVLAVLQSTLASFLLVLENTAPRGNRDGFDGFGDFGGCGGCGGFGHDGFSVILKYPGIPRVAPRMAFSLRKGFFFPKLGWFPGF